MTRALNLGSGLERPLPTNQIALTPESRARIEQTIEALLAVLDEADGDPDLEDMGDYEPYLSGFTAPIRGVAGDDREHDDGEGGIADSDALHALMP
jgi:hypothetical protein